MVSVQLPEPTAPLLLQRSRCAPSLRRHRTTPFGELLCQVSLTLFHLPVLQRNPNPLLDVQDLTGAQSASLIGR
jgi:hypothetical protein